MRSSYIPYSIYLRGTICVVSTVYIRSEEESTWQPFLASGKQRLKDMEQMGSTIFLGMFRVWGLGLRTGSKLLEVYCSNYYASGRT